jgi:anti-sigma B factor antagonist
VNDQESLVLQVDRLGISTVVRVAGGVDLATAPRFAAFLREQLEQTRAVLMVELLDVTYLGSCGLSALLSVREECARRRVDLVFGECSPIVRRAFEVSGLTEVFLGAQDARRNTS